MINDIKNAIKMNKKIEDKLNVIIVISNASSFESRFVLTNDFIKRIKNDEVNVNLYVVELAYGNQKFTITDSNNSMHLQLRTKTPLWHKENLINLGVKKLLPLHWKAFAWIDADLEFENFTWVDDTLKILNGECDIVQLFSHAADMDQNEMTMSMFNSGGYHNSKKKAYCGTGPNFWHPGYAWAITRVAYEKLGGLYDKAILGSGDSVMCLSLMKKGLNAINVKSTTGYKESISLFQNKIDNFRYGYVPGVIRHYFHGSKKNRKYVERWGILLKYNYDPSIHITTDKNGILIPTDLCPLDMLKEIENYFSDRKEDEGIEKLPVPVVLPLLSENYIPLLSENYIPLIVEVKKNGVAPVVVEVKKNVVAPIVVEVKKNGVAPVVVEVKENVVAPIVVEVKENVVAPIVVEVKENVVAPIVVDVDGIEALGKPFTHIITQKTTIVSFKVLNAWVTPFSHAKLYLDLIGDDDSRYHRAIDLGHDAYLAWSSSDEYLGKYVNENIETIYHSS